ncbi:MORF4 family associated protein 1 like 2-like isoform X2 [Equus asinus]|uniref:MORF4 family associated protein 1 like 2-like isoform X2 n=1 Tax=Equus asinus TaxID=9793 RepID=UPI0038F6CBDE
MCARARTAAAGGRPKLWSHQLRGRKGTVACRKKAASKPSFGRRLRIHFGRRLCCEKLGQPVARHGGPSAALGARCRPAGLSGALTGPRGGGGGGAMRPVDADDGREPERDWETLPSPALDAARRDAAALEREHVRAHLRARRKLLEIESLLDALKSEVEASQESAVGAGAEERVMRLCEKVERKAAEAALMGQRLVELHRQIDGCGLPTDGLHSAGKED